MGDVSAANLYSKIVGVWLCVPVLNSYGDGFVLSQDTGL